MPPFSFNEDFTSRLEAIDNMIEGVTTLVEFKGNPKKYVFNIYGKNKLMKGLKVGDRIKTKKYNTYFVIVNILEDKYRYVNKSNGDLKNRINNTNDIEIVRIDLDSLPEIKRLYVAD